MKHLRTRLPFLVAGMLFILSCKKQTNDGFETQKLKPTKSQMSSSRLLSYTASNWMGSIPDATNIAHLSIPGTHDSGARNEPVAGTAKCQNLSIADQLVAGVRYLDIRCRHIGNSFAIHHGAIYQNLNFTDVLNACIGFLDNNPTETIIMSVKEEHTATDNTRSFEETFDAYVQQNPSKWNLGDGVPTLGSIRGKIKLLRRFGSGNVKGIDATNWADNTTFTINNSAASLKVQDYYNVNDVNTKWSNVSALLNETNNDTSNKLYLNYSSGYKALIFGIPSITTVSNSINPKITTFFTNNTHGKYGIIAMDFIDAARSQLILNTNF